MEKKGNANNSSFLVPSNTLCSIPALIVPFEKSFHFDSNNTTKNETSKVNIVDENNNLLLKISTRDLNFFKRNNT